MFPLATKLAFNERISLLKVEQMRLHFDHFCYVVSISLSPSLPPSLPLPLFSLIWRALYFLKISVSILTKSSGRISRYLWITILQQTKQRGRIICTLARTR